jgi:hypothetical protein
MTVRTTRLRAAFAALAAVLAVTAMCLVHAHPAAAEASPPPGTTTTPVLGWSSWSFFRRTTDASVVRAEAQAMQTSGLENAGFRYVNLDDFWYQCKGPQGPNVDQYGRWVVNTNKYPEGPGGENGIQTLADYVHSLGLKFGIYVTPGISDQAVAQNTQIQGSPYTADQIADNQAQQNYNCRGMTGIDYTKPGAQAFTNSIVDEFASWGVDYIKLDGITNKNVADVKAWSDAIRQSGRPMQLDVTEGSYTTKLGPTIDQYATQWESTSDIEAYGKPKLTGYDQVVKRFGTLAMWEPMFGGAQNDAYADFDSVEVGDCENHVSSTTPWGTVDYTRGTGLSLNERKTVLSLWSMASSPIILGDDLTQLCPTDLKLITNPAVLALDQTGIDATPIVQGATQQVVAKSIGGGVVAAGLFNTGSSKQTIAVTASALGLAPSSSGYNITDLWSGKTSQTKTSTITETVPTHGVALLEITPAS